MDRFPFSLLNFKKNFPELQKEEVSIIIIYSVGIFSLLICNYFGQVVDFKYYFSDYFKDDLTNSDFNFYGLLWWAFIIMLTYCIIPLCVCKFILKIGLNELGLSFKGFLPHLKWYLILILPMFFLIYYFAQSPEFLQQYPFFKPKDWGSTNRFIIWELVYAIQFFCVEFFFRGFLMIPAKRLGAMAVFIMLMPYVMIHFTKPFPEAVGSFFGGLILGVIVLKTGSIWGGVLLHVFIAITMDLMALHFNGYL